ncbi:hypothetical protein QBC32DRAFT_376910 [Pseudoneurospora amorphoporcata]|uniref:Uncharacterized protein n=1 Tax=Pseudoneurospora amorphoporcata TaxID=241081 RepID=A0AAN6NQU6_9PEZI|nr:hypothetical protein QBC32DRAFT_376910 [Pseudoneurospora amorphoporcata]
MAISFWPSAFEAQDQHLMFPKIADIKAMAIAAFAASSVAHVPISTEAFEIANILSIPQEFQTLFLGDLSQDVGMIDNIKKARRMNAIIDATIKDITPTEVNKTTHEANIVDNVKNATLPTDSEATAPLLIEDDKSSQVAEVSHQGDLIHNVDIIFANNRDDTSSIADKEIFTIEENNKHIYHHVLPAIDITEVNISMTSKITDVSEFDDMGASASSMGHDFERFLKEDKMQWVHSIANQPELCTAVFKTKKQAIVVIKASNQDGKAIASDIKPLIDNKTENIAAEEKVVDTEVDIVHHARRLSNETDSSTETDKTTDSDASRATTPDTPETDNGNPEQAEEDQSATTTLDASSFDHIYNYGQLSPSDFDATLIMERLDSNRCYVQMTCGYWYVLEDDDEIRPMSKAEYQEFIEWTSQTPVITREDFNKKQQADAEQGIITSKAIAIIEVLEDDEESDGEQANYWFDFDNEDKENHQPIELIDYESADLDLMAAPDYQDQDEATTGSGIELLDYTDLADDEDDDYHSSDPLAAWDRPNFVIGSDEQIYWMCEGMFRLLDARELDQFNRWRDGDVHAFDEEEEGEREQKTWVRAALRKKGGRMTNEWYAWSAEMESIEEEDEDEEVVVVWRD